MQNVMYKFEVIVLVNQDRTEVLIKHTVEVEELIKS